MNYPRMLYIGSVKSYKYEIAQNQNHESELRELGYVDFADLEIEQVQISGEMPNSASSEDFEKAFVPIEQFDAISKELVHKGLQLDEFQNNVEAMKARIAEIQGDTTPIGTVSESPDYNSLTTPQLQKILDDKGIAYLKRDNKETLLALLTQPVKAEE
ncbi:hypothetical protein I9189_015815 [Acinetobacter bereziniae]|uniref:hypothetical protein n=1 Tax=Acinetobacter bereziniae TaxID=106648 RepID=UPI0019088365|nr:hypothetical protein [Acinetobacter bereziniae]QQC79451.1 hypothetical protein I9192_15950 [Acinetobacter bereziniae]UUN92529.1 hypothetical protein I9189_015815 [Acinetobacter bereziniae]